MRIYGLELLRGLTITLGHFITSYMGGIFTVPYPEKRLKTPERFRVLPMLIFDGKEGEKWKTETERCTACGICAQVCPPQCIWIVQGKDPATGKPVAKASEFFIDVDVCMNCGFCAEYCPFDAIKMDHTIELGGGERDKSHIFDIDRLHVSTEYHARIHPVDWAQEQARKKAAADKKAAAAAAAAMKNQTGSDPPGSDPGGSDPSRVSK